MAWNQRWKELEDYKKTHDSDPRQGSLAEWCEQQAANVASLPIHQKQALDALGFQWNAVHRHTREEEPRVHETKRQKKAKEKKKGNKRNTKKPGTTLLTHPQR